MKKPKGNIREYGAPAAGWGALKAVVTQLIKEKVPLTNYKMVLKQNQPKGFDCPGCAWPDRAHTSTFEFCENGIKAVAAESTSKRVTQDFFAQNTVTGLMQESDYALEEHGRLTSPMVYDQATGKLLPEMLADDFKFISPFWKGNNKQEFLDKFLDPGLYINTSLSNIVKFDPVMKFKSVEGEDTFAIILQYPTKNGNSVYEAVLGQVLRGCLIELRSIYDLNHTKLAHNL